MHIHTLLLDWSIPATKKTRAKMRAIMKLIRMKVFSKCKWRLCVKTGLQLNTINSNIQNCIHLKKIRQMRATNKVAIDMPQPIYVM